MLRCKKTVLGFQSGSERVPTNSRVKRLEFHILGRASANAEFKSPRRDALIAPYYARNASPPDEEPLAGRRSHSRQRIVEQPIAVLHTNMVQGATTRAAGRGLARLR